ncbi:MAG: S1 family peptidase [Polyangiales bacterium]
MNHHFLALLVLLSASTVGRSARADDVGSRGEYIVNGEPSGATDLRSTVAILEAPEGEVLDDSSRRTLAERLKCTGVLMSPSVVITAAHCYSDSLYVAAGLRTLDDVWTAEIRSVREAVAHGTSDIMLLVLDSPLAAVTPAAVLPAGESIVGDPGIAQGYGRRRPDGYLGPLGQDQYQSLLNETNTPVEHFDESWVATAEGPNQSGICFGDSGGPLYISRGNQLFVAGIASLLLQVSEDPECGFGALYVPLAGHLDWINEETASAGLADSGGCSASPAARGSNGLWLLGLALLLLARARSRSVASGAVLFFLAVSSAACGSDAGPASFCNERYDPSGRLCDPGVARIDLRAAEERARDLMPNDAWLWSAAGGEEGAVNPDGESEAWTLRYYIPSHLELPDGLLRRVTVYASEELRPVQEIETVQCIPREPMVPFDSKALVHDAVRRLERAGMPVQFGHEESLLVAQSHRCARRSDEWSGVEYARTSLYYGDDGSYLGMEKAQ